MDNNYYHRLENRIDWALQQKKITFQEIVRECQGAYPIEVLQILKSKRYSQTEERRVTYQRQSDGYVKELVTETIDHNPVLCSWYFSIPTCRKVVDLYSWDNKKILFLGMPRLFEYFVKNAGSAHFTLIDLDDYVVDKLKKNYACNKNCQIIHADINNLGFKFEENFDFIFLDPPWYMEYYDRWIAQACTMLNSEKGVIFFPLFQELTRPDAEEQRKFLLDRIEECTKNCLMISDFIEYEIPTFENGELQNYGVILEKPWKKADLIIVDRIRNYSCAMLEKTTDENSWHEVEIFNIRIFIHINEEDRHKKVKIRYLTEHGAYLKNPSRRNQELKSANMLTSRGQGYIVESPKRLLSILKEIKEKEGNGTEIRNMLDGIDTDNLSKEILFGLFGGETC